MRNTWFLLGLVTACGGGGGGDDGPGDPDANLPDVADAMPSADAETQAPAMITISGIAGEGGISGTTPVQGVSVALFLTSNESTPIATDTSDAQGAYSFTIPTGGVPVDAYVRATMPGTYMDSYIYPPAPYAADAPGNDANLIARSNFDLLGTFAQGNQQPGMGFIAMIVVDAAGTPVAGATVASSPAAGPYRYDDASGFPSASATSTADDGFSYMFNVPGRVEVSAMKPGHTFRTHAVFARPDAFTTTSIAP
jgi:hypothetical protein